MTDIFSLKVEEIVSKMHGHLCEKSRFKSVSESSDLDYKLVRTIVEAECGHNVPCKLASKLEQMVAEQWAFDDLCSFWVSHLCSDAEVAERLKRKLMGVKLMQAKPDGCRDSSKAVREQQCEDV